MKINKTTSKTPIVLSIGVLIIALLTAACESEKTPSQVTLLFWKAIAENNINLAKKYSSANSKNTLSVQAPIFNKATNFEFGKIIINGEQATVETVILLSTEKQQSFTTFLIREEKHWKVDYQQSLSNISANPFNTFFKHLDSIGKNFNKALEKQIPLLEKELNSLGQKLQHQVDKLEKELNDPAAPSKKNDPYKNSI